MAWFTDILDIDLPSFETFTSVAESVAKVATAGAAIYSTVQKVDIAREQADIQRRELERQQRLSTLQARRTARITKAGLIAQEAAGGIASSIVTGRIAGIETDLTTGIAELEEATAFNISQLGLEVADVERAAIGGMVEGVFTAGVETMGLMSTLLEEEKPKTPTKIK
jgi:hypothetical protein